MDLLDKFKFCRVMFPCLSHTTPFLFSVCSSNTFLELLLVVIWDIYNDIHAKIHENIDQIVAWTVMIYWCMEFQTLSTGINKAI